MTQMEPEAPEVKSQLKVAKLRVSIQDVLLCSLCTLSLVMILLMGLATSLNQGFRVEKGQQKTGQAVVPALLTYF
jgi:hypothetical protein